MSTINFMLPIDIYKTSLMVSIAQTDADLKRAVGKQYGKRVLRDMEHLLDLGDNTQGSLIYNSVARSYILRLEHYPDSPQRYGVLAHEVMHFVIRVLKDCGLKLNKSSEEAYTYLCEYVTSRILKKIS